MFRKLFFRIGSRSNIVGCWVLSVWLCSGVVCASAPEIEKLSLHGLRSGATTTLTIEGRELRSDSTVLLSVPVAFQFVRKESSDTRLHLDLRLDESTPSGIYQLRVANDLLSAERKQQRNSVNDGSPGAPSPLSKPPPP